MDAPSTAAFDQLTGYVGQIRETTVMHFKALTSNGVPPNAAADMAAEVQSTLLQVFFPDRDEDDE